MTSARASMDPTAFVDLVFEALVAGRVPPDPVSPGECDAAVQLFPGEAWRWAPAERERVELRGGLPDPMDEDDQAKLVSTLLERADVFGPIVRMLAASSGDSDAV
jgi:hypothetical protein